MPLQAVDTASSDCLSEVPGEVTGTLKRLYFTPEDGERERLANLSRSERRAVANESATGLYRDSELVGVEVDGEECWSTSILEASLVWILGVIAGVVVAVAGVVMLIVAQIGAARRRGRMR